MIFSMRFHDRQAVAPFAKYASLLLLSVVFANFPLYTYAQSPLLSPQPRELHAGEQFPVHTAAVAVRGTDPEDFFAAQNLETALTQSGLLISPANGKID